MHSANNSNKSTYYFKDRTNYSFNIDQIVTFTRKIHSFPAIVLQHKWGFNVVFHGGCLGFSKRVIKKWKNALSCCWRGLHKQNCFASLWPQWQFIFMLPPPIQLFHLRRNSICLSQISRQLSLQLIQFIIRIEERKYF